MTLVSFKQLKKKQNGNISRDWPVYVSSNTMLQQQIGNVRTRKSKSHVNLDVLFMYSWYDATLRAQYAQLRLHYQAWCKFQLPGCSPMLFGLINIIIQFVFSPAHIKLHIDEAGTAAVVVVVVVVVVLQSSNCRWASLWWSYHAFTVYLVLMWILNIQ